MTRGANSNTAVSIRRFAEPDFDDLVRGWHETNLASYPYCAEHQRHTLEDAFAVFRGRVLVQGEVWVAETSGAPVGLLALRAPWIDQFCVFPEHQRRGVGTALLSKARGRSPQELRLYTFQRNAPARAFYERHGFTPVAFGVSPAPECEPDVEYRWSA
jgi:ribosomal protein S18 acetylase RimI-like enzyme